MFRWILLAGLICASRGFLIAPAEAPGRYDVSALLRLPLAASRGSSTFGGRAEALRRAARSTRLFKRAHKEGRVYGGGGAGGRYSNYNSFGNNAFRMEGSASSLLHDDLTSAPGRLCEESYQRLSQKQEGNGAVAVAAALGGLEAAALGGLEQRRYRLSEQIDDENVESTVDLRPNGEVVFVESRGGAAVKSIHGSWQVDSATNMIRMVIDRKYEGRFTEINVRSHYSGFAQQGGEFSSGSSSSLTIGGEVCDEQGCDLAAGFFRLLPAV